MENEIAREHEVRVQKIQKLKESGVLPYAYRFDRTHEIGQALEQFDKLVADKTIVRVAGRLLSRREHGKTCFGHIADGSGKIQLYVRKDILTAKPIQGASEPANKGASQTQEQGAREPRSQGASLEQGAGEQESQGASLTSFDVFLLADIGDFIGVAGELMTTKTGEKTVLVKELEFLAKSFHPLPEKFHGLTDVEARYRQRYVDLIANPEVKSIFVRRAKIVSLIRRYLDGKGFTEVETPVLQPVYGGAAAHPFTTHYEALDQNMFLRISDELYLKRLIVGGMDKVYEFGRDFRNEGLDRTHNPEFTQLELYEAYRDYNDMMTLVEEVFRLIAMELYGKTEITYEGKTLDFGKPWQRLEFVPALAEKLGADPLALGQESLRKLCARFGIEAAEGTPKGKLLDKLFSELIQDHLVEPTFVMNHPKITTPLAKQHRSNPELVERFEPVVCGMELGNAFSELNDPAEQSARFKELMAANEEFATFDADYVTALEYGMPPCGGLGIGIDRLTMLFTGHNTIREVILFPQLRAVSSE